MLIFNFWKPMDVKKIRKILIANRGEIAVRIIRSCREMGIKTVAVYSDADRASLHVQLADEAYNIGPAPSAESYLNIDHILKAARKSGAQAIHPGYGFLSENAEFARRCKEEGILFIGPSPESIEMMGNKLSARRAMIEAGVPVVPGSTEKITDELEALKTIQEIGVPIMIKAAAGGGGRGMRLVRQESQVESALRSARSEAKTAFGDDAVYIEKYIDSPHHIEFQILADQYGNTVHLYERECSIQRRHQKVIEETPSPLMTPELRKQMGDCAVAAAKAAHYSGAGTIEFIVDDELNFYFLEMNTRLQVEHPVTEMVVGVDLVKEQIRVSEGRALSFCQYDLCQKGHSIECRIYAEDTDNNFMPNPGKLNQFSEPTGPGVRCDGYVYEGFSIPVFYDSMISKLIVWGANREEALQRMSRALDEFRISGIKTTIGFLKKIIDSSDFKEGHYNTHFIEKNSILLNLKEPESQLDEDLALIAAYIEYSNKHENVKRILSPLNGKAANSWKQQSRKHPVTRL
jgi:acetyl-CoA carboxylase biotin carboxylase subunit